MDTGTPLTNWIHGLVSNIFVLPSMNLNSAFARPKKNTVLKVKRFKEDSLIGSNGALFSWFKTSERFQEGMPLLPLGLSLGNYPGDKRDFCPC